MSCKKWHSISKLQSRTKITKQLMIFPSSISELKQRVWWCEFCQIQHWGDGGGGGGGGGWGLKIIKNKLSGIFLSGIVCKTIFFWIRYNFFLWGIAGLSVCLQCVCLLSYGNADNKFSIILICACVYIYIMS